MTMKYLDIVIPLKPQLSSGGDTGHSNIKSHQMKTIWGFDLNPKSAQGIYIDGWPLLKLINKHFQAPNIYLLFTPEVPL